MGVKGCRNTGTVEGGGGEGRGEMCTKINSRAAAHTTTTMQYAPSSPHALVADHNQQLRPRYAILVPASRVLGGLPAKVAGERGGKKTKKGSGNNPNKAFETAHWHWRSGDSETLRVCV